MHIMKKALLSLILCVSLVGCAAPSVITGNSRSVVIDDGQYTKFTSADSQVKAEADKWCAKYGRVSSVQMPTPYPTRHKEFECVAK